MATSFFFLKQDCAKRCVNLDQVDNMDLPFCVVFIANKRGERNWVALFSSYVDRANGVSLGSGDCSLQAGIEGRIAELLEMRL